MSEDTERKLFLEKLTQFNSDRGVSLNTCPTISKQSLDLYRLYCLVKSRGGFRNVSKSRLWKEIALQCNMVNNSNVAYAVRKQYIKHLLPYECEFDLGGVDPASLQSSLESSRKKGSVPSPGSDGHDSNSQGSYPQSGTPGSLDGYPPHGINNYPSPGYPPSGYPSPNYPPSSHGQGMMNSPYPPPLHPNEYNHPHHMSPLGPHSGAKKMKTVPSPGSLDSNSQGSYSQPATPGEANYGAHGTINNYSGQMCSQPSNDYRPGIGYPMSQSPRQHSPHPNRNNKGAPSPGSTDTNSQSSYPQQGVQMEGSSFSGHGSNYHGPVVTSDYQGGYPHGQPMRPSLTSHPKKLKGTQSLVPGAISNYSGPMYPQPPSDYHSRMVYPSNGSQSPKQLSSHPNRKENQSVPSPGSTDSNSQGSYPQSGTPVEGSSFSSHGGNYSENFPHGMSNSDYPSAYSHSHAMRPPHPRKMKNIPPISTSDGTLQNVYPPSSTPVMDQYSYNSGGPNNFTTGSGPNTNYSNAGIHYPGYIGGPAAPIGPSTAPIGPSTAPMSSSGAIGPSGPMALSATIGSSTAMGPTASMGPSTPMGSSGPIGPSGPINSSTPMNSSVSMRPSLPLGNSAPIGPPTASGTSHHSAPTPPVDNERTSNNDIVSAQDPFSDMQSNGPQHRRPQSILQSGHQPSHHSGPGPSPSQQNHLNTNQMSYQNCNSSAFSPNPQASNSQNANSTQMQYPNCNSSFPSNSQTPNSYFPRSIGPNNSNFSPSPASNSYFPRLITPSKYEQRNEPRGIYGPPSNPTKPGAAHLTRLLSSSPSLPSPTPYMTKQPNHLNTAPVKKDLGFPGDCVESTLPNLAKTKKLTSKDIPQVEAWKLLICLKSGLLAESTWALDVLTVLVNDDNTILYFGLSHLPGLLENLLDHYKKYLDEMFPGLYSLKDNRKKTKIEDDTFNNRDQSKFENEKIVLLNGKNYTMRSRKGKEVKFKEANSLFMGKETVSENRNESDTMDHILTCMESKDINVRFAKIMNDTRQEEWCKDEKILSEDTEISKVQVENVDNVEESQQTWPRFRNKRLKYLDWDELEQESWNSDDSPLSVIQDYHDSLSKRCVCLSTLIRNISFVPGNDVEMCKNSVLLKILGKLIMLKHIHPKKRKSLDRMSKEENIHVEEEEDSKIDNGTSEWWSESLHMIRENTFVILANIAGQLDLGEYDEEINYPIIDGLLHYVVCPSSYASDPLPSSSLSCLSPKRLALEILTKLSVLESNVDLILATKPWIRTHRLLEYLIKLLNRNEEQTLREFSLVLLSNLVIADTAIQKVVGENGGIGVLISFIEQAEMSALSVANSSGVNALRENPELMGTTLDMVRRAAGTLRSLSDAEDNKRILLACLGRLLALVMSQILDQGVARILADVIYQCSLYSLGSETHNVNEAEHNENDVNKNSL